MTLQDVQPEYQKGAWYWYSIPYSYWDCRIEPNRIGFENIGDGNIGFCLDKVVLEK